MLDGPDHVRLKPIVRDPVDRDFSPAIDFPSLEALGSGRTTTSDDGIIRLSPSCFINSSSTYPLDTFCHSYKRENSGH